MIYKIRHWGFVHGVRLGCANVTFSYYKGSLCPPIDLEIPMEVKPTIEVEFSARFERRGMVFLRSDFSGVGSYFPPI